MTYTQEKLYLQSVFDVIDEVYKFKSHCQQQQQQQIPLLTYEQRLRASFNKLRIPDWYNHQYASINGLRKTKSHGQVPRGRLKQQNYNHYNNNSNDDTPDTSVSSSTDSPQLANGKNRHSQRHRSPSRSWSERPPPRRDSTASSCDTNGSVIHCRRSSSGVSSSYTPGMQRVAQSSTWYKPRPFVSITNGHSNGKVNHTAINEPPKPLPRYSKIDQERTHSTDSSSQVPASSSPPPAVVTQGLTSVIVSTINDVRHPIKPRTMAQAQAPSGGGVDEQSSLLNISLDVSSDGDITIVQKPSSSRFSEASSSYRSCVSPTLLLPPTQPLMTNSADSNAIPRTNSSRSIGSDADSYRSAVLPPPGKNLLATDSSSYASVDERSISSASYYTAKGGDTSSSSSMTGYETPTPQLDNDDEGTLSSRSSVSDLSHTETLAPTGDEDLDIAVVSTAEQKPVSPLVDVGMENQPPLSIPPATTNTSSSLDLRPSSIIDNNHWYEGASIETCINQPPSSSSSLTTPISELREISNDEILHEIDLNAMGDEFFLLSPRTQTDDEPSSSISEEKQFSEPQTPTRIFTMTNDDEFSLTDDFHCSSTVDPFGFNHHNNNQETNSSSIMITNLDDFLIEDDDDDDDVLKNSGKNLLNINYRRPIQEDILYEVEHENSFSDHSQNASSITTADDAASIKIEQSLDFLTSTDESASTVVHVPIPTPVVESPPPLVTSIEQQPSTNDNNILPIYILPPLFTTSPTPPQLHVDTTTDSTYLHNLRKWDSLVNQFDTLSSPSSYTSKIRHRQYSVGSYYDHKTTTVTIHPNHQLYLLGSAPVSPLSRGRTPSGNSDSHYLTHHSPVSLGGAALNALRRVNPFLEVHSSEYRQTSDYYQPRASSLNREENHRLTTMTSRSSERTTPPSKVEPIVSPPSTRVSSVTFPQYELPIIRPKTSRGLSSPPSSPPPIELEQPLIRPKTSRGRLRTPPPIPPQFPERSFDQDSSQQNIYQEISTDEDHSKPPPNADLQFIRGAIERVFEFHGESTTDTATSTTSESSTFYEQVSVDDDNENESLSSLHNSSTLSKKKPINSEQYPAVEAVQRFYNKENGIIEPITNLDDKHDTPRSPPSRVDNKKKDLISKSKSSDAIEGERASSEEVDDTLNDIEEDDYQDENQRIKRENTSNEHSPILSSRDQLSSTIVKKPSQETQTSERHPPFILTRQSPSGSQSTIQSYQTANSSVPAVEIITQMVIEREDGDDGDDGEIGEISGDMVIFYDDIEIVEHSPISASSSSESETSCSSSRHSKSIEPPPPIPARTLKPVYLLEKANTIQQQQQPIISSSSTTNKTYELEKSTIRRKFDVNSVSDMLNRADYYIAPSVSHRHPSARHFVGKLNSDESSHNSRVNTPQMPIKPLPTSTMIKSKTLPTVERSQPIIISNGHHSINDVQQRVPTKSPFATLPSRSASSVGTTNKQQQRSIIADTNALVKQIQNSLSRNSLHDSQLPTTLSTSSKDLRTFVSTTYTPSDENIIDDNGIVHIRPSSIQQDDQAFKRQARLSRSFHNVSEYNSTDQYPNKQNGLSTRPQPSKSVENHLDHVVVVQPDPQPRRSLLRASPTPMALPPMVSSTSFSTLPNSDDSARLLSMKWYTGQVSENSEICYNTSHTDDDDLLYGYISTHGNRECQNLLARLQTSNDVRIHAALDDIRQRVAQFDLTKSQGDLQGFMRYLESRLRDVNNKISMPAPTKPTRTTPTPTSNGQQKRQSNGGTTNGHHHQQPPQQQSDTISIKSRTSSTVTAASRETPPPRQLGRQHQRSTGSVGGGQSNGHQPPPPRRSSQSSSNQENPAVFDDMLNTVLGLPKKGVSTLPQNFPSSTFRDNNPPLDQTPMITNTTSVNKTGRDIGKRLFESGIYKDPRLVYDGPRKKEKEEQPLETSV